MPRDWKCFRKLSVMLPHRFLKASELVPHCFDEMPARCPQRLLHRCVAWGKMALHLGLALGFFSRRHMCMQSTRVLQTLFVNMRNLVIIVGNGCPREIHAFLLPLVLTPGLTPRRVARASIVVTTPGLTPRRSPGRLTTSADSRLNAPSCRPGVNTFLDSRFSAPSCRLPPLDALLDARVPRWDSQ